MSTLKKKGMHKYKMSELYNEGNDSIRDRASIYRDSYLSWQLLLLKEWMGNITLLKPD